MSQITDLGFKKFLSYFILLGSYYTFLLQHIQSLV